MRMLGLIMCQIGDKKRNDLRGGSSMYDGDGILILAPRPRLGYLGHRPKYHFGLGIVYFGLLQASCNFSTRLDL